MNTAQLSRGLGAELRRERKRLGWTRRDLLRRLDVGVSVQTVATWELGTRSMSVTRFMELCAALGISADELLARVTRPEPCGDLRLNLRLVLQNRRAELEPLRRWARVLLATTPEAPTVTRLHPAAMARLAELCGVSAGDLVAMLEGSRVA